jgi:large subunit ribosomal protein L6
MGHSRLKAEVARILKKEGYVADVAEGDDAGKKTLRVVLKYDYNEKPIIQQLRRVSKPGLRRYVAAADIPRVRGGLGTSVLSTSRGLMSDREARRPTWAAKCSARSGNRRRGTSCRELENNRWPCRRAMTVSVADGIATLKGPKGELSLKMPETVAVAQEGSVLNVVRTGDDKQSRADHGTTRALLQNMVVGVKDGYSRALEIQGVGFKASIAGNKLTMNVGYSHPVEYTVPDGVTVAVADGTQLKVSGIDKQLVGQVSARIRSFRPPEPYKGKGVRYKDERVRRKAGKTVA